MIEKDMLVSLAVLSIRPEAKFLVGETYESLTWHDKTQDKPTKKEFNDAVEAEKKKYTDNEYQRSRASEYPSIADVVVALAEKEEGDSAMWDDITAKRQAVKTKYKKG